jgi:predicted nucleic acid-binding protein
MPGSFLDSNIVLYLASEDPAKADRAQELVAEGGTISVQVLNEIANVSQVRSRLADPKGEKMLRVGLSAARYCLLDPATITLGVLRPAPGRQ